MVAWQPVGIVMGVYDMCHRYLLERRQFGAPLAALQINQEKLVRMLGNVQAMFLMGYRLCQLYEKGTMTPGQASLAKVTHCQLVSQVRTLTGGWVQAWNTKRARETVALGRELLGGNGIIGDFLVAKVGGWLGWAGVTSGDRVVGCGLWQAFCDLEPIYTYEGTYEINSLVVGREVLGVSAIKPPSSSRQGNSMSPKL